MKLRISESYLFKIRLGLTARRVDQKGLLSDYFISVSQVSCENRNPKFT